MREDIRDSKRNKIGSIDTQLNGRSVIYNKMGSKIGEIRPNGRKLEAFDKLNRKFAYWDESNDTTYDRMGKKITKGNVLVMMFFQE